MIAKHRKDSVSSTLACQFAFWFGLVFATPLFIAIQNTADISIGLGAMALAALMVSLLLVAIGAGIAGVMDHCVRWWSNRIFLTLAVMAAVQGNIIHGLFEHGVFDGGAMDFRAHGWQFWLEWYGWLLAWPLIFLLLTRVSSMPGWLPLLPILSFMLLLLPAVFNMSEVQSEHDGNEEIDASVFAFSTQKNLIHLLPDGFQGDVVREVLEKNPELAEVFRGFTLFTNHVGQYQGTAPALFTILTGQPYDFSVGFDLGRITPAFMNDSYPVQLAEMGFQVDYVPISHVHCIEEANSCHTRSFGDMKSRGLLRKTNEDLSYALRLITDLSLFRLSPLFIKEKIYDDGHWFLADTTLGGSSPWPDPVIREWTENMHLVHDRPVYKWHHFIGTHIPAKWDANCRLSRDLEHNRENYLAQAKCVLSGIASLLQKLDELGVYDQTAIIISGDHGHNIMSNDVISRPFNSGLFKGLHGQARPTLLIKESNNNRPLRFDIAPTTQLEIAPTALALAGVPGEHRTAYTRSGNAPGKRLFTRYSGADFYSGKPVPNVVFEVNGAANDPATWRVTAINPYQQPPERYQPVNYTNAFGFMHGVSLDRKNPDAEGSWVSGRQLAFLLDIAQPQENHILRLVVHIPDYVVSQSLTVAVNKLETDILFKFPEHSGHWQTVELPIDASSLKEGSNFFSLVFERTDSSGENGWYVAAQVKSIQLETVNP